MSQLRQLAAIMFTDIVGYTALMGKDEQKAFSILEKNRQIQKPVVENHRGRWLKEIGDGVLASFETVSDAVYAAIEIQEACRKEVRAKEILDEIMEISSHQHVGNFDIGFVYVGMGKQDCKMVRKSS